MLHIRPETAGLQAAMPGALQPVGTARTARHVVNAYHSGALPLLPWPEAADDASLDAYVYQSREFLNVWLATMGEARRSRCFLVIVETTEGRPVMWLPLAIERDYGCTVLRFPDASMADYNAPVLARDFGAGGIEIEQLWAAILRTLPAVDLIDFVKMPATIWDQANPLLGIGPAFEKDEGYCLPITGTHADYLADPSRKQRARKLGQLYRKLERVGTVELGEIRDTALVAKTRVFMEHHKALQYRRTLGFNQFDRPGVRAFIDRLFQPEALATFTRVTALRLDGDVLAAQLDFVTPRRQQGLMTTFDAEQHGFVSPGRQVQLHLIQRAFSDRLAVFDLGHGENAYKHPWMTERLQLYSLQQARTLRGRMFVAARGLRRRLPGLVASVKRRLGRSGLEGSGGRDVAEA